MEGGIDCKMVRTQHVHVQSFVEVRNMVAVVFYRDFFFNEGPNGVC